MAATMPNGGGTAGLRGRAARGSALILVAQAARIAIQLGGTIMLARLIAPDVFGLLAMVLAIAGIAEIFRDFGLSQAALRRTDLTQQQQSNLFWLNAACGFALAILLFALSWPISAFYGHHQLITIVQWIAPIYLLNGVTAQFRVRINQALRFRTLAVIDIAAPLLAFAGALLLALFGYAIPALIAVQVVGPVVALLLSLALARWRPTWPRRTPGMRELLTFGASFAFTQTLSYATRNVDSIAIGKVWGAGPLGYYDRAFQLAVAPLNQINAPMSRVAIPVLARVLEDRPKYVSALREAQLVATYVTSTLLLVAAGLGTPLLTLLLGEQWARAGTIFSILAIGSVFRSIQQIAYWMFMTHGLASSQLQLYTIGQPIIISFILIGVMWGPIGVAIASTAGWTMFWLMSLLWVGRVSKIDVRGLMLDPLRVIATVGLPAGVAALVVARFVPFAPIWIVLIGFIASMFWVVAVIIAVPWVRRDARALSRFLRLAIGK